MTAQKQDSSIKISFSSFPFATCVITTAVALLSLTASAGKKVPVNARIISEQKNVAVLNDTIITGIVKDVKGNPIANAKVSSAVSGDVYTNSDGLFSITLKPGNIVPQSFIFTYDTLMQVVRSYHPAMENAMYDIVLEPKKCCLGNIWIETLAKDIQLPSVNFKPNTVKLSPETKSLLKDIAATLKDNPEVKITATAYPSSNDPKQRISAKRVELIKEYLIEQEGISSDRISVEKKPGEGDGNVIDFKKQ